MLSLRTRLHKTFHLLTTQFQVMCIEVFEVTEELRPAMEHRPHSGPERCKYFCLYKFSFLV